MVKELLEDTRSDMEDWMEGPDQNPFGVSAVGVTGDSDPKCSMRNLHRKQQGSTANLSARHKNAQCRVCVCCSSAPLSDGRGC